MEGSSSSVGITAVEFESAIGTTDERSEIGILAEKIDLVVVVVGGYGGTSSVNCCAGRANCGGSGAVVLLQTVNGG